ncbi:synergin gamma-like isoform X2 [Octopus vulgaris]|uniref:Synergin gamma-like isoform X2 n=1 Tax=Octopus vulgaris TaxID=6645 RepID=A0AA36FER0_OCTVU|nr:synergin gamma-like isoform X2 [Octopus vulgaris]
MDGTLLKIENGRVWNTLKKKRDGYDRNTFERRDDYVQNAFLMRIGHGWNTFRKLHVFAHPHYTGVRLRAQIHACVKESDLLFSILKLFLIQKPVLQDTSERLCKSSSLYEFTGEATFARGSQTVLSGTLMPCKVYLHAPRISKINVDFSQMQTGFNPLQGPPAASAAAAQFYPVPASSAQYGMMAPGMLAGNPMIAQGIYPVQVKGILQMGTYIATPMAIPTTMMSAGNIPPPPPYTPQMAQSFHAQQANQQFHATMVPGIVHGVVPGQMIAGVPVNAHIVEDQRKGKHFHEQQMKLKLFGRLGVVSSDPDRMIESMFGKVPKSKPKVHIPQTSQTVTTTNTTTTTAIDSDPDSFGDFMQGPSSEQSEKSWMGSLGFSSSSSENNPAKAPPPANEEEEEETKDLMAMMLQYSDLNVSQKAKTFQNKKTLRETNLTNVTTSRSASYTSSERSRKWQDGDESLSGLFKVEDQPPVTPDVSSNMQPQCTTPDSGSTTPTVSQYPMGPFQTLPSWCYLDDDQIPHVYRQVYEASSANDCIITDRLYPILLLSDLPRQTLREIWEVCNMTTPGQLSKQELYLLLSLIAVAQNNQGIPSMEILHQLPSPPVPFFNQASATQITPTQQNAVTSFGASSPPSFATQDASLASGGTLLPNSSSTVRPPTSVPFENTPTSLLETTFDSLDQFNMSPVTDVNQVNCNSITPVTKVAFEALPELSAEDKYSNVRNFFCSDDSSGTSTNSFDDDYDDFKSADSKPSDDTSQFSTSEQSEAGHDPQSNIPPPYDIAVKNSVLASNVNPVDDDDPGWAEFQVSSNSSLNNWADFTQITSNSGENTSIHPPKVGSSTNSFSEKKQSVESDGSNFDVESGNSANSNGSSLVTIVKDNLQRGEILSLFKVRENVPRENTISHEDTLTRNDGVEGAKRNASKKEKAKVKLDNSAGSSQNFQQQPSAISASNVSLNLSSEIDLFHEPPPLDDSVEGEDEFGGFSRGIDSFDFTERTGFPASVPCSNLRPGPVHMPKGRNVEAYSSENQSTCQPGNFDFADEDSHSSKDTDSLSWQDNNKFQKEDSQSVSSLELSYNSAGRQNQRDPDMAADSQSVSSSEFPAFETLQKQETTLESKSLDSLEFRNDDQGWGEICDNNGENVPDDNKNRCVQNLTAETPVGTMPTLPQPVPPQTVVNKENLIARDRYSSVIQDVQGSEHHCHEWTKCLDKCYQRIKEANNVFNSISTSCVCNEVIKSCQGADYIMAIIEIYRVVCKITVTMRMSVLTNERLETLLKDIDLAWNNLAAFLSASSLLSEVSSFNYTSAVLKTDDTASQLKACGVCLLNVDVFDRISNDNERAAKLTYSGRQYHTTCANFWVNCVDSMLPALKLPQLI